MLEKKHLEKQNKKPLKRSERIKKTRKVSLVFIACVVIFLCLYLYLVQAPFSKYREVVVSDSALSGKVKNTVENILVQKTLGFFPNNSTLSVSLRQIKNLTIANVSEIESVSISRKIFKRELDVKYTLRTPVFKNEQGQLLDTHNSWYQDERVFVLPVLSTTKPVSQNELNKLIFLKDTVETALFQIEKVTIDELSDVVFVLKTESLTEIKFSLNQNEKEVWSKLVSGLDTTPLKENKDTFSKVLYLDTRFGNKIYYKMQLGEKEVIPISTATTTYERQ